MFSLIITVESIRLVANLAYATTARQYANETETHLKQDEGYCIPSLIWPPPNHCVFCINLFSAQTAFSDLLSGGACHD